MQGLRAISNRQLAEELGVSDGHVRNALLYAKAADHCGQVPGWPSEDEIAGMGVREVRKLLGQLERGQEEPEPELVVTGLAVEHSHTVKKMIKTLVSLAKTADEATETERATFWGAKGNLYEELGSILKGSAAAVGAMVPSEEEPPPAPAPRPKPLVKEARYWLMHELEEETRRSEASQAEAVPVTVTTPEPSPQAAEPPAESSAGGGMRVWQLHCSALDDSKEALVGIRGAERQER
jgi:hypothetical protein